MENNEVKRISMSEKYRPTRLNDVVGQDSILGNGKMLTTIIEKKMVHNLVFYGPPGTGKTTVANIYAGMIDMDMHRLNATNASVDDIRRIIRDGNERGILLYLDEIQYFNKKQQQMLLPYLESGEMVMIAATTENPAHCLYPALMSRMMSFRFEKLSDKSVADNIVRVINVYGEDTGKKIAISNESIEKIAVMSCGDVRKSLEFLDAVVNVSDNGAGNIQIDDSCIEELRQNAMMRYDLDDKAHSETMSAFQKSIRGSDTDAALFYLAQLIKDGDLQGICRRLLVTASEDIGLAYPQAVVVVKSCVDMAVMLGFPEARIPLSEAVIMLSVLPKSNSAISAIDMALGDVSMYPQAEIPRCIRYVHGAEYKNPHDYKDGWVRQEYMPSVLRARHYYKPGNNRFEQEMDAYWKSVKSYFKS